MNFLICRDTEFNYNVTIVSTKDIVKKIGLVNYSYSKNSSYRQYTCRSTVVKADCYGLIGVIRGLVKRAICDNISVHQTIKYKVVIGE